MTSVRLPEGFHLESLDRQQPRREFRSGQTQVDDWLATKALQQQDKHLSVTKVLLDEASQIAGFYTLAIGEVDFSDLPLVLVRKLPRRQLPVAILAWLGVQVDRHGHGFGSLLLAQALRDCFQAGQTFAFIAVILDCIDEAAKAFYQRFDFQELPGRPLRLFLSMHQLQAMMESP